MPKFRRNVSWHFSYFTPFPSNPPPPITCLKAPYWSGSFSHISRLWLALFPKPSFLKPYISPQLTSFVTSDLKMETACFSETLASTYETTRHPNPIPISIEQSKSPDANSPVRYSINSNQNYVRIFHLFQSATWPAHDVPFELNILVLFGETSNECILKHWNG
jgi:hypothetical protein